jgi:CRISPR-associated protein Cas1
MTDRILDFSDEPARLSVRNFLLVIKREEKEDMTIPVAELAVIVISHPMVTFTQSVLSSLCLAGGTFITCDDKHMPVGILLPIAANFTQTERFAQQANSSEPLRKNIWQQIIKAKIKGQGNLLKEIRGDDFGLCEQSTKVLSGDTANVEARAARTYWGALFDDPNFRRAREVDDQNRFLNYGYMVLRAIVARGICASGLHPSIGVHHHNKYDAFCLASDLMEPLRPIVDRAVYNLVQEFGTDAPMDKEVKTYLLSAFLQKHMIEECERSLFEISTMMASSLCQIFGGAKKKLALPDV